MDVGFGDDVFPVPVEVDVPGLIGFPAATLRAYPREAVVAEKLYVMAVLGVANNRMKVYYDLWILGRLFPLSGVTLSESVTRTFARRRMPLPLESPFALTAGSHRTRARRHSGRRFCQRAVLRLRRAWARWLQPWPGSCGRSCRAPREARHAVWRGRRADRGK